METSHLAKLPLLPAGDAFGQEVPAGMVMGHTSCGCHFWHLCYCGHLCTPCPGAHAAGLTAPPGILRLSCSQHLPGVIQPCLLKCRHALESLNSSTSVWSCNDWSLLRTSWRRCQKPSQLGHPQMSSGSEKNLIFPLQGEEERYKNRIRYASPSSSQPLENLPSFGGRATG